MKAYLDNDVVSAIGKSDFPASEMQILQDLLAVPAVHQLHVVTSSVTRSEIARYEGQKKSPIEQVYNSLMKVQFIEDHNVLGAHSYWDRFGGESCPLVEDN